MRVRFQTRTMIRFHLDERMSNAVAHGLELRGIDVITSHSCGLNGASDATQLAAAHAESRVLVTHDDDFLVLNSQGEPHSGIAYSHPAFRTVGQDVNALVRLWRLKTPDELLGSIEYL